jgi:hypothetical protein
LKIGTNELYEIEKSKKKAVLLLSVGIISTHMTPYLDLYQSMVFGPQLPPPIHDVNYP